MPCTPRLYSDATFQITMKCFLIIFLFISSSINAQDTYASLIKKAKSVAQDSVGKRDSFKFYLKAFNNFPDDISENDQYWFTVLAAELNEKDLAFKYLPPLAAQEKDEEGYPGWDLIVGDYSEEDYHNLFDDVRWEKLKKLALKEKEQFFYELLQKENEFNDRLLSDYSAIKNPKVLYQTLKTSIPFHHKKDRDYSISFEINDSTKTSFFIHLPLNYNPEKKYTLLFFLHGAVNGNSLSMFQTAEMNLGGWNRFYTKYADQNDVILVFPSADKTYNWMAPDDGFFMVPKILRLIKKTIHIDDNKVFISGHSNGATGSFSYLMKNSSAFAGFYGFNTYPKVMTGGTFVENIKNRSFINFSTDQDYYYPPNANDNMTILMQSINADYKDYRFNGYPHWFPKFDASEPAFDILFKDLNNRHRQPLATEISWEFDDNTNDNIDWLHHIKLDTLQSRLPWQKELNFKVTKWLKFKGDDSDDLIAVDVDQNAFDFPRKSGKIKASYRNNVFNIETSRIKAFSIAISPEMVTMKNKIKVYVNGKLYFNDNVSYDRNFILQNFEEFQDREQLWVNKIQIEL